MISKNCRMCEEEKKLCMAHILPKALKTILNAGKTNDHLKSVSIEEGKAHNIQTLEFDKEILCSSCDGILGKYDRVLVEVIRYFFDDEARNKFSNPIRTVDVITDTEKLKLAIAAVLYRMSLSKRFSKLYLGKTYEPEFKTWLQNGSIPEDMRSWLEVVLFGYNKDKNDLDRTMTADPLAGRAERIHHYFLFLPGLLAIAKVGKAKWTSSVAKYPRINANPENLEIPVLNYEESIHFDMLSQASVSCRESHRQMAR